mgnify:CR=1 FL=1
MLLSLWGSHNETFATDNKPNNEYLDPIGVEKHETTATDNTEDDSYGVTSN